jgi:hypothetical protein
MNIKDYINKDAILNRVISRDVTFGKKTYQSVSIKIAYQDKRVEVSNRMEKKIVSKAWIMTLNTLNIEDTVTYNGKTFNIIDISQCDDIWGKFSHWEALLN